jgi:superfamily II DNA/RNA helicase
VINEIVNGNGIRDILCSALNEIHERGPVDLSILEKLSLIKKYHGDVFKEYENKLLSIMGLFYKMDGPSSFVSAIYTDLGNVIARQYGHSFTPVQAAAYKSIEDKHYYSFSAPTSTGKSYLFRELIKDFEQDIVIVVPSRALIAEFYSSVIDLVDKDVLVLQFVENVNQHNTSRRIYIITPERGVEIFKYSVDFDIGLFLFDEAQISEEPVRGISFDAFVRRTQRVFPRAKKVFAHPFVNNPDAQIIKHNFNVDSASNKFLQNNVGKIFAALEKDGSYSYFSPYTDTKEYPIAYDLIQDTLLRGGTVLIYTSKSKIFHGEHVEQFGKYIELCPIIKDVNANKIIDSLIKYIGASRKQTGKVSSFIQLMHRGIVVHHGSMPLKARLLIEHFVRAGHAKLCFATSTLAQGINMPFDCVLIDNFHRMEVLTLKNLIGRSGRSSRNAVFDYGYTIIKRSNVSTFKDRINEEYDLAEKSKLDIDTINIPADSLDLVEAIKNDSFNDELHLTNSQVDRMRTRSLITDIKYILDNLIDENSAITGSQYYSLGEGVRRSIKDRLKNVFQLHLRKDELSRAEKTILSASIPILLWKVHGKSFSEIISLRYSYLTKQKERRDLIRQLRDGSLSIEVYNNEIRRITIRYSARAEGIPNAKLLRALPLFPEGVLIEDFDYDLLVYDTYDYLDKVIGLSLSDPLCAALVIYYDETGDYRAEILKNYLRFGTNNVIEIWLLKYGFDPEDVEWITHVIVHIDENGIIFKDDLSELNEEQLLLISRYR